ncbi:MAG: Do family serine endopeptidase [Planctomycetales bacterium]|nr:Do family serine endopeptidase [Planctomycetales bacterium]
MLTNARWRQNAMVMFAGSALVIIAVNWSQKQEAVAIPNLPNAQDLSVAFRSVSAEAMPSIVSIETTINPRQVQGGEQPLREEEIPLPLRLFSQNDPRLEELFKNRGRQRSSPKQHGKGSGFIIDGNGIILTNNHVVNGADEVKVRLYDGREFIATEVKTDPRTDVAIVRIEASGLKALQLGDSHATEVGDWVLAIGSPFGLDMTVTAGIISAKGRNNQITQRADFLQTDAAINPGNSGGPLISLRGEVIGINTAIATESGGYDGIGFAIPTHIAGWVSQQLIASGEVKRGYLGTQIQPVDASIAKQFKVKVREGALVRSVMPNSPAEKAGLEPGDVVLKLNGRTITDPASLQGVTEQLHVGTSYPMEIVRDGKALTLTATIEAMPQATELPMRDAGQKSPHGTRFDKLGLEVRTLTKDLAKQLDLGNSSGVVISAIEDGSPAAVSGLKSGDVIEKAGGQPVATAEDYENAKSRFSSTEGLVLHIRSPNGKRLFVILKSE